MSIAVRSDMSSWQLTNTVGHVAAFLGNKMQEKFDTGDYFESMDGLRYPRNSQYAVVALNASHEQLHALVTELRKTDLLWIAYVQEMIDLLDDDELEKAMLVKDSVDMSILGVGIFGDKDHLKSLTGHLKLWK